TLNSVRRWPFVDGIVVAPTESQHGNSASAMDSNAEIMPSGMKMMLMESSTSRLIVRGLSKSFGARVAVEGIGFSVAAGEIYGLLGPNGAGKTTSISMIAGILTRDGGEITIDGIDIDAGPAARALIGIVPQAITLYLDLTAHENLDFWGRM